MIFAELTNDWAQVVAIIVGGLLGGAGLINKLIAWAEKRNEEADKARQAHMDSLTKQLTENKEDRERQTEAYAALLETQRNINASIQKVAERLDTMDGKKVCKYPTRRKTL